MICVLTVVTKFFIGVSFVALVVECSSDVIINNKKYNLPVSGEVLRNSSSLKSLRKLFEQNIGGVVTKQSVYHRPQNLVTKYNFYQNGRPKPISLVKDFLVTKNNFVTPSYGANEVFPVNSDYISEYTEDNINNLDSEIKQANLLNFLNISSGVASTESSLFEQSIENPEISVYDITSPPNYYPVKSVQQPNIIYNTHQYYDFLNYVPPINNNNNNNKINNNKNILFACRPGEQNNFNCSKLQNGLTNKKTPVEQIKPAASLEKITATKTSSQQPVSENTDKKSNEKTTNKKTNRNKQPNSTPVFIFTYPTKPRKPTNKKPHKKLKKPIKDKIVMADSPVVLAVENTLEGVYNYFEDLFTDTVQYPTQEVFETVEVDSDSSESQKPTHKKKKRNKTKSKTDKKKKHKLHTTMIPIPYLFSDENDSSDDNSMSSSNGNDDYYDSSSSEEYVKKTERTIAPTTPSSSTTKPNILRATPTILANTFVRKNQTNVKLKQVAKLPNKRITVRSLAVGPDTGFTTPISFDHNKIGNGPVTPIANGFTIVTTPFSNIKVRKSTTVQKVYDSDESSASDYYDDYFDFTDSDSGEDGKIPNRKPGHTTNKMKIKLKKKKVKSKEIVDDLDDIYQESGESFYDDFGSMLDLSPISNFLPPLPSFNNEDVSIKEQERSTTPNNLLSGSHYAEYYKPSAIKHKTKNSWYSSIFKNDAVAETTPGSTFSASNWLPSLLVVADESNTETPSISAQTTESSSTGWWWFPWLADGDTEEETESITSPPTSIPSTTTMQYVPRPSFSLANPLTNAGSVITFLSDQIRVKSTKAPEPENLCKKMDYNKFQLWRIRPESTEEVETLEEYRMSFDDSTEVQWWKGPSLRSSTEILVSPNMTESVEEFLNYEDIKYEIIMKDVNSAISYENPKISKHEKLRIEIQQGHPLTWYRYHSFKDIISFLGYLHRQHPDHVELIHLGRSFEGRPLILAKIHFDQMIVDNSKQHPPKQNIRFMKQKLKKLKKKAVFIECGVHGREWISPAVGTWILNNLMNILLQNDTAGETVRSVDWYVMPVMNPDGYQYSFKFDRFWRKTRSYRKSNQFNILSTALHWMNAKNVDKRCYGVDPNRNWDVEWGTKGASQSKCSEFYGGPEANSEPEIKALSTFLMEHRKQFKLFISLHSYGQFISFPTMSNATYSKNDIHDVHDMILVAIEALRNKDSASRYKVDMSNDMMPMRSGSSDSFAMHEAGIKYSYTMELRDTGHHGFLLPASYIERTARNTFEMIKAMVDYL